MYDIFMFYYNFWNELLVFVGFFQFLFYDYMFFYFMNFGFMGSVIVYYFVYGIDYLGILFLQIDFYSRIQ